MLFSRWTGIVTLWSLGIAVQLTGCGGGDAGTTEGEADAAIKDGPQEMDAGKPDVGMDMPVDPCEEVVCDSPPAAECIEGPAYRTYGTPGSCEAGSCSYPFTETPCINPNGSTACEEGVCVPTCAANFGDCDGNPNNGCETSLTTLTDCGSCGTSCDLPNALESCASGVCTLTSCFPSAYWNCDGDPSNGCETTISTLENCGACGTVCDLTNASESCVATSCTITSCNTGWGNCDGVISNGCETSLAADTDCGACGVACTTPPSVCYSSDGSCVSGACTYPFADGTPCSDGDGCTSGEVCSSGTCTGGTAIECWTPTPTTGAPAGRRWHTAIWEEGATSPSMVVWGGWNGSPLFTGGTYSPVSNLWFGTAVTGAPTGRYGHTAVWTGSEMIVWGGNQSSLGAECQYGVQSGGQYYLTTWTPTPQPSTWDGQDVARACHTSIWTGSEMLVWGGNNSSFIPYLGLRYTPTTDSWDWMSTSGQPGLADRFKHTAVWTGSQMIVWGGSTNSSNSLNTGGRYNPTTDFWFSVATSGAPLPRRLHSAIWTGSEMIIWGGRRVWFDPISGTMSDTLNTGGRYDPSSNTWTPTTTVAAPAQRYSHTAVWTGFEMLIWGGYDGDYLTNLNSGGRYDSSTDTWISVTTVGAPSPRRRHTAVWTGSEMIVWGGCGSGFGCTAYFNTGGRYTP